MNRLGKSEMSRTRSGGFTLIELLVVIAIIAVLAAMLMPAVQAAIKQAMAAHCASNMHQVYVAMQSYMQDYDQVNPIRCSDLAGILNGNPGGGRTGDWMDVEAANVAHKLAYQGDYLDWPPTVFFCPAHGISAADWFPDREAGDPFYSTGTVHMHGTYCWMYNENDPNVQPNDNQRADGYWNSLMVDTGDEQRLSAGRGIHYNVLHLNGNVEVNAFDTRGEMDDMLFTVH